MREYSPIVLFVYNRPLHTLQTLEALMMNSLANKSTLYIYADGPKSDATNELKANIASTREIIRKKMWCKAVIIIESEVNKGLANSIIEGITDVIDKYEQAIILEDDILTSTDFLTFMNNALTYYRDDIAVAGISGFRYPSEIENNKVFFLPIGCSWGWATWKRQWDTVSFDSKHLLKTIQTKRLEYSFDFGGYPFLNMLRQQIEGHVDSWAIRFYASFFLQSKCFVYPPSSLVQNNGFDQTATHTVSDPFFSLIRTGSFKAELRTPVYDEMTIGVRAAFEKQYLNQENYHRKPTLLRRIANRIIRWQLKFV